MTITITGSKYAPSALSEIGTTTVVSSAAVFVETDFDAPRMCYLLNFDGSEFRGLAYVRRFLSATSLELEAEFFDPKDGSAIAQTTGDTMLVSKNWGDVAQTGIAISHRHVTITDDITFGTVGDFASCCFYDEGKIVDINITGAYRTEQIRVKGGLWVDGHMIDYALKSSYGGSVIHCNYISPTAALHTDGEKSVVCKFGGRISNTRTSYAYVGPNTGTTEPERFLLLGVELENVDVVSPQQGEPFSSPDNNVLDGCTFSAITQYTILSRWANGINLGGSYKFPMFSSLPLSVFGSDSSGTFYIGAAPGGRSVVSDIGDANSLWRSNGYDTQQIYATNLISTNYNCILGTEVTPNPLANISISFADIYANLKSDTCVSAIINSTWLVDGTATSVGDNSEVPIAVLWKTGTGTTTGAQRGPWTTRIRAFGYDELEEAIVEEDYSLGTAGIAKNVSFGGFQNQLPRTSLTGTSKAEALAHTGISVTDHGASPVTWSGAEYSITITGNLSTNPTLTSAQIFEHVKAKIAEHADWGGKSGMLWHVLVDDLGGHRTQRGRSGGAGSILKGVRVVDENGGAFPGFVEMTSDDGSMYVPPTQYTITVSNSQGAFEARVRDGAITIDHEQITGANSYVYAYQYSGVVRTYKLQIGKPGFITIVQDLVLTDQSQSITLEMEPDPSWVP